MLEMFTKMAKAPGRKTRAEKRDKRAIAGELMRPRAVATNHSCARRTGVPVAIGARWSKADDATKKEGWHYRIPW